MQIKCIKANICMYLSRVALEWVQWELNSWIYQKYNMVTIYLNPWIKIASATPENCVFSSLSIKGSPIKYHNCLSITAIARRIMDRVISFTSRTKSSQRNGSVDEVRKRFWQNVLLFGCWFKNISGVYIFFKLISNV